MFSDINTNNFNTRELLENKGFTTDVCASFIPGFNPTRTSGIKALRVVQDAVASAIRTVGEDKEYDASLLSQGLKGCYQHEMSGAHNKLAIEQGLKNMLEVSEVIPLPNVVSMMNHHKEDDLIARSGQLQRLTIGGEASVIQALIPMGLTADTLTSMLTEQKGSLESKINTLVSDIESLNLTKSPLFPVAAPQYPVARPPIDIEDERPRSWRRTEEYRQENRDFESYFRQ